jgi:hypothetical protein
MIEPAHDLAITKQAKALQAAKCFEPSPRMTGLHLF